MPNDFINNLKKEAEENPVLALGVAAALLTAASKLANAMAWRQEVTRRRMNDLRK
jgi:hypothetical protein